MKNQHGIVQLQGTYVDVTFYKRNDGTYGFKKKGGIPPERIATGKQFDLLRKAKIEFASAAKSAKNLRDAFASLMVNADNRMISRLHQHMKQVLNADSTNNVGERTVATGDLMLLEDFDFNKHAPLSAVLRAPFTTTITRSSGTVSVSIPSFLPGSLMAMPPNATHFKITAGAKALDFANTTKPDLANMSSSSYQTTDGTATSAISLSLTVPAATTDPILVVMSIQFFVEYNGNQNPVSNSSFNAVSIIKIDV